MAIGVPVGLGFTSTDVTYSSTALSISASAIPNDSLVVVFTGCSNNQDGTTTNPVSGVAEGANNYALAVSTFNAGTTNLFYQAWYFYYATGVASPTITTSWAKINRLKVLQAVAVTGILSSGSLDKTNSSTGTGTSASTATGALSQANEIVLAGSFVDAGTSYASGANFTNTYSNANSAGQLFTAAYDIVASTSSVTHAPSWTGSSLYSDLVASFKASQLNAAFNLAMLGM